MAEPKVRKPRARHRDVIFGAIDERLQMLGDIAVTEPVAASLDRIRELLDELKRSLNGKGEGESE